MVFEDVLVEVKLGPDIYIEAEVQFEIKLLEIV